MTKAMRVLQLGKFYPVFGGVEKVMWDLTKGLSESHVPCDMLCCGLRREIKGRMKGRCKARPLVLRFNDCGSCIVVPAIAKIAATMLSPRLVFKLRAIKDNYDVIHVHHPDPMAAVALMLSGYRGKVVLHWHSDILKQQWLLKFYYPVLQWMIRRADVIVGTTPVYVQNSPLLIKVQDKIQVIPIGINPVIPDQKGAERVRAQFPGKRIVYSLGRLVEYKGYDYLVEAARYLPDDYHILIGGEGPMHRQLEDRIREYGVQDKVTLMGFIDDSDFAAYYTACDVFALSSIYKTEAFAIVQIEAMSCGKPVVATQIQGSGVSWVNSDGDSGRNVCPRDAKAMAAAIESIVGDDDVYGGYCARAYQRYRELFTYDVMIEKCKRLYEELL